MLHLDQEVVFGLQNRTAPVFLYIVLARACGAAAPFSPPRGVFYVFLSRGLLPSRLCGGRRRACVYAFVLDASQGAALVCAAV